MLVQQQQHEKSRKIALHFHCAFLDADTDRIISRLSRHTSTISVFLHSCITRVLNTLYTCDDDAAPDNVRSVSFFMDHMPGVAYTKGSELDPDHKEIHLSVGYFAHYHDDMVKELEGVVVHELVHCFQFNGRDASASSGFIEGVADYVRLKCHLAPRHWDPREIGHRWDDGYQKTAYFLVWLDRQYGPHTTRNLNLVCRDRIWNDDIFFDLTGLTITELWNLYVEQASNE